MNTEDSSRAERGVEAGGELLSRLRDKAAWVWRETIRIHARAPETRVASSLSPIEVLTCLYYGGVLRFDPARPLWPGRDRLIISKGHGSICMYPILADLGFFPGAELERVARAGSFLGGIPDPVIPGYETVNGSLGHGPGVAAGMALALKRRGAAERVFVLVGDGELHEGAVWEAVFFAAHHGLDNLVLIVDDNGRCMLNDSVKVLKMTPLVRRFEAFDWRAAEVDGHDVAETLPALLRFKERPDGRPSALIARTIKGRGAPTLERSPISHVLSLPPDEVARLLEERDAAE